MQKGGILALSMWCEKEVLIILLSNTKGCDIVTSLTSIAAVPAQAYAGSLWRDSTIPSTPVRGTCLRAEVAYAYCESFFLLESIKTAD